MLIIPAIDIQKGKCVRLFQGNFADATIYSDDPVEITKKWEKEGAKQFHIVDLDGAKSGVFSNYEIIEKIVQKVKVPLQVGGGIRDKKTIKKLLTMGINKIILGTVALENKFLLEAMLSDFASYIVISLDAKGRKLMKKGWQKITGLDVIKTAKELEKMGVKKFIYTDILKDGMMVGPNFNETADIVRNLSVPVIVSGGISNIQDIKKLKSIGAAGVIIGKALYEGKIKLREAMNAG